MPIGLINSKRFLLKLVSIVILILLSSQSKSTNLPKPNHVVICILENHSYQQIVASVHTPYINSLILMSANLQEFYALTHPSQPNYLMLFSGSNQGVTSDNLPPGTPWTTPNLGASLINSGSTFVSYSEGLPNMGSTVGASGAYARKHCPWVNWQGNGVNQIPASSNLSMNDFPTDFNLLPDVSFVIPDQNNDMHNGSDPERISVGDIWVEKNLKAYVDWAQENNSLFILTFDEDNFTPINRILCLFIGPMVRQGNYYLNTYNLYDLLRTIEEMFKLPYSGNSANAKTISEIWMTSVSVNDLMPSLITGTVYPNPLTDNSRIVLSSEPGNDNNEMLFKIFDINRKQISEEVIYLLPGSKSYAFRKDGLSSGIYTFQIWNEKNLRGSGKFVVDYH